MKSIFTRSVILISFVALLPNSACKPDWAYDLSEDNANSFKGSEGSFKTSFEPGTATITFSLTSVKVRTKTNTPVSKGSFKLNDDKLKFDEVESKEWQSLGTTNNNRTSTKKLTFKGAKFYSDELNHLCFQDDESVENDSEKGAMHCASMQEMCTGSDKRKRGTYTNGSCTCGTGGEPHTWATVKAYSGIKYICEKGEEERVVQNKQQADFFSTRKDVCDETSCTCGYFAGTKTTPKKEITAAYAKLDKNNFLNFCPGLAEAFCRDEVDGKGALGGTGFCQGCSTIPLPKLQNWTTTAVTEYLTECKKTISIGAGDQPVNTVEPVNPPVDDANAGPDPIGEESPPGDPE